MSVLKKSLTAIIIIAVLSGIGGHFYFDRKFSPPNNNLTVSGQSGEIPITWVSNESNSYAALLLPIKVVGVKLPLYMQLDFGSPTTLLYSKSLRSLKQLNYNATNITNSKHLDFDFYMDRMQISSSNFKVIDHGQVVDLIDPEALNIVGTIGTDLLEKRVVMLDFQKDFCQFSNSAPIELQTPLEFKKRRILLPATIDGKRFKLLYDSGTSGYELITSKKEWEKYRNRGSKIIEEKGNSWGHTLQVKTASTSQNIEIGGALLKLSEVTYIEGTSTMQNALMALSGMEGMIGNKLFLCHRITIDCTNERFALE